MRKIRFSFLSVRSGIRPVNVRKGDAVYHIPTPSSGGRNYPHNWKGRWVGFCGGGGGGFERNQVLSGTLFNFVTCVELGVDLL
jgi:hypothetical protein